MKRKMAFGAVLATLLTATAGHTDEIRVLNWQGYGTDQDWAIAAFTEARSLDPSSDEAVIALADALRNRGLPLRADAILIDYARRHGDPSHRGVHYVLLDLARANGDAEGLARALSLAVRRGCNTIGPLCATG